MIRPFQPFDTISTRRSAPDATGYIIRESLRTVPSSAVRLTADLGLYRCFMDAGGGKTGPGRLFVRRIGRPLEPNVPGRIRSAGSLFLHRNPAPSRERMPLPNSCPARLAPARGTVFGYRIHGYAGRYLICCPMHAIPGIPRRTGSGCRYRNSCPARLAPARGTVFGYRIHGYAGRYLICCPMHAIPGIPRRTGSGCRYRNSCPARLAPARGTVFGYRYEKRCLFRFIRNISFPGSLRAAREWMPLLKLLPGGVSPRPGTSGFFIPSPACRFSPARC